MGLIECVRNWQSSCLYIYPPVLRHVPAVSNSGSRPRQFRGGFTQPNVIFCQHENGLK